MIKRILAPGTNRFIIYVLSGLWLTFSLSGCVGVPKKVPEYTFPDKYTFPPESSQRSDITHNVAPGETVWRIAKMYDVSPSEIIRKNSLSDSAGIIMGQDLIIPSAAPIKAVVSLYPSKKWKYIIIHHSATEEGNALSFNSQHISRGFSNGLGYHFVIDNGTRGKFDGQVEVSPRWIGQENGAHCKANDMNLKAIGICLVGNFNWQKVSGKQMDSLVALVKRLKRYYRIPDKRILGHGQVPGAKTDCPGKKFPWKEFWARIR